MPRDREKYNAWKRAWNAKNRVYVSDRTYLRHGPEGLTAEHLRAILRYDQTTGLFIWLVPNCMRLRPGAQAGSVNKGNGYVRVHIQGKTYGAHRLAWLYVYGEWPTDDIDHINGDRADNRLANLRDVSTSVNCQNQRPRRPTSTTGLLGVSWHKRVGKFKATIGLGGKNHHIGYFDTAEAAHAAYLLEKRTSHDGCTI